jgi:hypothetical protein
MGVVPASVGGDIEGVNWVVRWLLSLHLLARQPLGPRTSIVMHELVKADDEPAAVELAALDHSALCCTGGWATQKPVG